MLAFDGCVLGDIHCFSGNDGTSTTLLDKSDKVDHSVGKEEGKL